MHQKPSGYSEGIPQLIPTFLKLWVRNTIFNTNTHNTCGTYSFGIRTNVNYSPLKHSYMEHCCWEHSHICGTQPCGRLVLFWISYSCWSECNMWYQILNIPLYFREGRCYQIRWIFGKVPKREGGGSFLIQKFILQIFGTLSRAFWARNWFKRVISGFRVCCFNNCIEKNQNQTHFEKDTSESLYYLALIPPCTYATISIRGRAHIT